MMRSSKVNLSLFGQLRISILGQYFRILPVVTLLVAPSFWTFVPVGGRTGMVSTILIGLYSGVAAFGSINSARATSTRLTSGWSLIGTNSTVPSLTFWLFDFTRIFLAQTSL